MFLVNRICIILLSQPTLGLLQCCDNHRATSLHHCGCFNYISWSEQNHRTLQCWTAVVLISAGHVDVHQRVWSTVEAERQTERERLDHLTTCMCYQFTSLWAVYWQWSIINMREVFSLLQDGPAMWRSISRNAFHVESLSFSLFLSCFSSFWFFSLNLYIMFLFDSRHAEFF